MCGDYKKKKKHFANRSCYDNFSLIALRQLLNHHYHWNCHLCHFFHQVKYKKRRGGVREKLKQHNRQAGGSPNPKGNRSTKYSSGIFRTAPLSYCPTSCLEGEQVSGCNAPVTATKRLFLF